LTSGHSPSDQVDVAMIFGGLHHCAHNLALAFQTIAGLLRPEGLLLMYEPNRRYVLEAARQLWYRFDRYFDAEAEAALDHDAIVSMASSQFEPAWCRHMGGRAYFLIYNSLAFRIPIASKKAIAPPLFRLERRFNRLRSRLWYPYFVARWRRTSGT
jgi:SAM-dependent methyltransferase